MDSILQTNRIPAKLIAVLCLTVLLATSGLQAGDIHTDADAGDLNKVRALIEADSALLESTDNDGNTPLISACWGPPANISQVVVARVWQIL